MIECMCRVNQDTETRIRLLNCSHQGRARRRESLMWSPLAPKQGRSSGSQSRVPLCCEIPVAVILVTMVPAFLPMLPHYLCHDDLTCCCHHLLLLLSRCFCYYYLLLLTTTYYYLLRLTTTYYYLLVTTSSYYLLLSTSCYFLLLLTTTTYNYLLLTA